MKSIHEEQMFTCPILSQALTFPACILIQQKTIKKGHVPPDTLTWELNMLHCEKITYARYRPKQVPLYKLKNMYKLLAQASKFNIRRIIHPPK